jgi:hypothetical protein
VFTTVVHSPTTCLQATLLERSSVCECNPGYGSWACQLSLPLLPLNAAAPTVVTVAPGQWGYWEVSLPPTGQSAGAAVAADGAAAGQRRSEESLLVTARRIGMSEGQGGNPLLFLKPFDTKVSVILDFVGD